MNGIACKCDMCRMQTIETFRIDQLPVPGRRAIAVPIRSALRCALALLALGFVEARLTAADLATSEREAEAIINSLASKNRPPKMVALKKISGNKDSPLFDTAYDWSDQSRILSELKKLSKIDPEVIWPLLLKYRRDERYSLTKYSFFSHYGYNLSIGTQCTWYINQLLESGYQGSLPRSIEVLHRFHSKGFDEWYRAHKSTPLFEMQIDTAEWAINHVATMEAKWVSKQDREQFAVNVRKNIEELKKSRKPALRGPLFTAEWAEFADAQQAEKIRAEYLAQEKSNK